MDDERAQHLTYNILYTEKSYRVVMLENHTGLSEGTEEGQCSQKSRAIKAMPADHR